LTLLSHTPAAKCGKVSCSTPQIMNKIDTVLEKSEELLTQKKFYEYEQKLKTLSLRYYGMGKVDDANSLLLQGSFKLLQNNEAVCGLGLAHLMLDNYKAHAKELTPDLRKKIIGIFEIAPYGKGKLDLLLKTLKCFVPSEKDNELQYLLAKETYKYKDFDRCQQYLITCDDGLDLALRMLDEWMDQGNMQEREFFVARFVLHKLAANRLEEARVVFKHYEKSFNTPLMHFIDYLFKAIELKSKKLFHILLQEYEKAVSKDPTFIIFIKKIATLYFGIPTSNESFGEKFLKFLIQ